MLRFERVEMTLARLSSAFRRSASNSSSVRSSPPRTTSNVCIREVEPRRKELAVANERQRLEVDIRRASDRLGAMTTGRPASADAAALSRLAARMGVDVAPDAIADGLLVLLVLATELLGGVALLLASPCAVRPTHGSLDATVVHAPSAYLDATTQVALDAVEVAGLPVDTGVAAVQSMPATTVQTLPPVVSVKRVPKRSKRHAAPNATELSVRVALNARGGRSPAQ